MARPTPDFSAPQYSRTPAAYARAWVPPSSWHPAPFAIPHEPVFHGQRMSPQAFRRLAARMTANSPRRCPTNGGSPTEEYTTDDDDEEHDEEDDGKRMSRSVTVLLSRAQYLRRELGLLYSSLCATKHSRAATKQRVMHVLKVDEYMKKRVPSEGRRRSWWNILKFGFRMAGLVRPRPPVVWRLQPVWRFRRVVWGVIRRKRRANELFVMVSLEALRRARAKRQRHRLRRRFCHVVRLWTQARQRRLTRFQEVVEEALRSARRRTIRTRWRVTAARARIRARVLSSFRRAETRRKRMKYLKSIPRLVMIALAWFKQALMGRLQRLARQVREQQRLLRRRRKETAEQKARAAIRQRRQDRARKKWQKVRRLLRDPRMYALRAKRKFRRATRLIVAVNFWGNYVYHTRVEEMKTKHTLTIRAAFRMGNTLKASVSENLQKCAAELKQLRDSHAGKRVTTMRRKLVGVCLRKTQRLQKCEQALFLFCSRLAFAGTYWIQMHKGKFRAVDVVKWELLVRKTFHFRSVVPPMWKHFVTTRKRALVNTIWWLWLDVVITQRMLLERLNATSRLQEFHPMLSESPTFRADFVSTYVWAKRHILPRDFVHDVVCPSPKTWDALSLEGWPPEDFFPKVGFVSGPKAGSLFGRAYRQMLFREWRVVDEAQDMLIVACNMTEQDTAMLFNFVIRTGAPGVTLEAQYALMQKIHDLVNHHSEVQHGHLADTRTELKA